jgi:hypothetical protein
VPGVPGGDDPAARTDTSERLDLLA